MADGASSNGGDTKTAEKVSNGQPSQPVQAKQVVATKVTGVVKWFNVKSGYGFINRSDTQEDVFVHQSAIVKNNPRKLVRSVGDGEQVEFDVVIGEKGNEAANVTGVGGEAVKGSPYAADRRRGNSGFYRRRAAANRDDGDGSAAKEEGELEGSTAEGGGEEGQTRRGGGRRFRGGRGGRYAPRYYRGSGRGGGRRGPRSDGQGDAGKTTEEDDGSGTGGGSAVVKESGDGEVTSRPRGGGRGRGRGRRGFTRRFYRRGGPSRGGGGGGGGGGGRQQSTSAGEQSADTQGEETEEPAKN